VKKAKKYRRRSPAAASPLNTIIDSTILSQPWYRAYSDNWSMVKVQIDDLQSTLYEAILRNIVDFISRSYASDRNLTAKKVSVIPTAVILTGINQSDHLAQFQVVASKIVNNVSSHVVLLLARDCPTVKATVETMISSFVEEVALDRDGDDEDCDETRVKKLFRKTQLTMSVLRTWYLDKYRDGANQNLVVVLPDFELFNAKVLQDLIMILR
jgi:origin recognition complex subunit 3